MHMRRHRGGGRGQLTVTGIGDRLRAPEQPRRAASNLAVELQVGGTVIAADPPLHREHVERDAAALNHAQSMTAEVMIELRRRDELSPGVGAAR